MRTTVTLDTDTERMIRSIMRERGVALKQALSDAIRAGLAPAKRNGTRKFTQKTYALGAEQNFRWEKAPRVPSPYDPARTFPKSDTADHSVRYDRCLDGTAVG